MKTRYIIFLLAFWKTLFCTAQQDVPNEIPTPNASNLGMYGNIPISHYTGRANVSIPIINMYGTDELSFPIYLQHDASGILVNSLPTWTGHNWTLMAGGAITRIIEGYPDEYVPVYQGTLFPFSNYFQSYNQLSKDINNEEDLTKNLENNRYDYAPDIFYFNFLGISGKFFLGNDGQWKVLSDNNLDIVFDINSPDNYIEPFIASMPGDDSTKKQPKVIKGFIIRDDKGYIYEFGGNNNSIEYSTNLFAQSEYEQVESWKATSWYLTNIKDQFGNILFTLDYERGKFIAQLYNSASSIHVFENAKGLGLNYGQEYYRTNYSFPYGGTLNAPVYLKRITGKCGAVIKFVSSDSPLETKDLYPSVDIFKPYYDYNLTTFFPFFYLQSDRADILPYQNKSKSYNKRDMPLAATKLRQLDEIQLCDFGESNVASRIKLQYSYETRMHIEKISICDRLDEEDHSYELSYHNYQLLPKNYLTTAADHWGYYTGKEYKVGSSSIYEDRQPVPQTTTYGLLYKITYPTGGYSQLSYEQNDFSLCANNYNHVLYDTISIAGGVRVHKIEEFARDGKLLQKRTFEYKNPFTGESSGELFAPPCYAWDNWMANLQYSNAVAKQSLFRSASIMPLSNSFGPHIGYSYVTEINADNTTTTYHYMNMAESKDERFIKDFCLGKPSPFDRFTDRGYKRGKLMHMEKKDEKGITKQKVSYSYPVADVENDYVLTSNLNYVNNGSSATFSYYTGGVYKLLYPKYDIIGINTTTYFDGNDSIVDKQIFNKQNHLVDINFRYPHKSMVRLVESECLSRKNMTISTYYNYGFKDDNEASKVLCSKQFSFVPIKKTTYNKQQLIGGEKIVYQLISDFALPLYKYRLRHKSQVLEVNYLSYYPDFKLKTYKKEGEAITTLKWYRNRVVIKDIGCNPDGSMSSKTHRYLYDWSGLDGISDIFFPNERAYHFYFDSFSRLTEIDDEDYRPITRYHYHYGK